MTGSGIGAGLAALAFWGFVAAIVVAGIWYDLRRREAQQETLRRIIESGQPIDEETVDKLLSVSGNSARPDRDFKVTALWILPIAPALAVFGWIMGSQYPQVLSPLLGVAALLAVLGAGFYGAGMYVARWFEHEDVARTRHQG